MNDHQSSPRRPAARTIGGLATIVASALLLALPALAHAANPIAPIDGGHLQYINVNPVVAFDVPQGETPKWVLIGTDAAMTNTVRFCRQFGGGPISRAMMGSSVSTYTDPAPAAGTAAAAAVRAPSGRAVMTSVGSTAVMPANFKTPFLGTAPSGIIGSGTASALSFSTDDTDVLAGYPEAPGGVHWTCRSWAVGADAYGNDQAKPLTWNATYYWQVVSTKDSDKSDVKSAVRSFTIDKPDPGIDPTTISNQIFGSVTSDGTTLNKGNAAFINSGLRVKKISSTRTKPSRTQIKLQWQGGLDIARSYVLVKGEGTTRKLKLHRTKSMGLATATWIRTTKQSKIANGHYTYQPFLVSVRNGSVVKSSATQVVVIGPKTKSHSHVTRVINW